MPIKRCRMQRIRIIKPIPKKWLQNLRRESRFDLAELEKICQEHKNKKVNPRWIDFFVFAWWKLAGWLTLHYKLEFTRSTLSLRSPFTFSNRLTVSRSSSDASTSSLRTATLSMLNPNGIDRSWQYWIRSFAISVAISTERPAGLLHTFNSCLMSSGTCIPSHSIKSSVFSDPQIVNVKMIVGNSRFRAWHVLTNASSVCFAYWTLKMHWEM